MLVFLPLLVMRARALSWLVAFPRSRWPGWILAGVDVAWFAFYVMDAGLPWVNANQWAVVFGALVLFAAIVVLVDDLLSVRALGALLLLAAQPMLDAAFVYESAWVLILTTFAYVMVVVGCVLVWSPYLFRKAFAEHLTRPLVTGFVAACGAGLGLCMLILALSVFTCL